MEPDPPGQPDLVVRNARVDDSTPSAGSTIRMDVDVYNQGSATASSSRLHYYWSNDATYSSSDTYIDDDSVSSLDPGETDAEYKSGISVPSTPGTYYLIACADAEYDVSESNENNNCTAVQVDVSGTVDLVVESASVSPSSPSPGATITMSVTVRNAGNVASSRRSIAFFRSGDRNVGNDVRVGNLGNVGSIPPGGTRSTSESFSVTSTPDTYYYIACLSDDSEESNTANNCSDGSKAVQVTVQAPGQPDLVVRNARVDDSTPSAGSTIRMDVDVYNQGNATASSSRLHYYRGNTYLDDDPVKSLDRGETSSEYDSNLPVPSTSGTYYYIACADAEYDVSESNENNNCASVEVTVQAPGQPDLVVENVRGEFKDDGSQVKMYVTVRNAGSASASSSRLHYYRSNNNTYSSGDTYLEDDRVSSLASGATDAENEWLDVPSTPGTYYYIACADADIRRERE